MVNVNPIDKDYMVRSQSDLGNTKERPFHKPSQDQTKSTTFGGAWNFMERCMDRLTCIRAYKATLPREDYRFNCLCSVLSFPGGVQQRQDHERGRVCAGCGPYHLPVQRRRVRGRGEVRRESIKEKQTFYSRHCSIYYLPFQYLHLLCRRN